MEWLSQNWVFVLIFAVFVSMHLFDHGGHGRCGSGHKKRAGDEGKGVAEPPASHKH